MYTMKETCLKVGMRYETLKFYCKEGLVPNIKRNEYNHRMFTDKNIAWIYGLTCLKDCGMSIVEMKEYLALCLEGEATILKRKDILDGKRKELVHRIHELQENIQYIDNKQQLYDDILSGKTPYVSNLKE